MPQGEAQPFQNVEYALVLALSEQTRHDGVSGIESNTDRYRLAMIDFVPREMFEFVGRPVSEIQRARRSGLEWVAAEPDLAHVQFRAILDQAVEMPRRELRERSRIAFDPTKEIAIADQRDLDSLRHARAFFACRQMVDKDTVVNNGPWRREGTNQILQAKGIDGVLDADAAVILCQHSGGKTDVAHAAVEYCCGISDRIQHRTSSDRDYKGVPVDRQLREFCEKAWNGIRIVLAALAARHRNKLASDLEMSGVK